MLTGEKMAPFTDRKRTEGQGWFQDDVVLFARRDRDEYDSSNRSGRTKERDDSSGGGSGGGGGSGDDSKDGGNKGNGNGGGNGGGNGSGNGSGKNNGNSDGDGGKPKSKNTDDGGNSNNNNDKPKTNNGSSRSTDTATFTPPPPPPITSVFFPPPQITVTPTSEPESTIVIVSTVSVSPSSTSTLLPSSTTLSLTSASPLVTVGVIPFTPEISTQPRKGVDGPDTTSFSFAFASRTLSAGTAATALADTIPTSSSAPDNGNNKDNDGSKHKNNDKNKDDNKGGLDSTAERVLISVGSIGSFILVCFVIWIVWRTMKKSKRRKEMGDMGAMGGDGSRNRFFQNRLLARVPFLRQRGWENLDDAGVANLPPPSYREKASVAGTPPGEGYFGQEKAYQQQMDMPPQLPSPGISRSNTVNSQFTGLNLNTGMTINPAAMQEVSPVSVHQAAPSFSSVDAAQFGTTLSTDASGTLRSRMPDAFFNQSELSRQPSDAYDPNRRQVNRVSELSSISSGFGDGDIIVPDAYVQPPKPASTSMRQSNNFVGRFSWMSSARRDRDTVYTQASEDSPPRFRSVTSWVNQQTGRVKRAQQKEPDSAAPPIPQLPGQVGVPGIHNPPAEQSFGMMMEDNEVPRPVEGALTNKPASS